MNRRFKIVVVASSTCLAVLLLVGAVMGQGSSPEDAYRHLAVFTEVISRIKSDYVEEPDMKSVTLGAVNGLLEAIDPYASFLSADQYKAYLKNRDSQKAGVGLILSKRYGYIGVVDTIPGSPSAKAGISTQDLLETIKGVSTRDMPLAYAELLLAGEPGSTVEISVLQLRRNTEARKITLTRAPVVFPPVNAKMLDNQIGQIEVQSLEAGKAKEIGAAAAKLEQQGARKLILDLRHSSAGPPEEGIAVANLFIEKGLLGYVQGQKVSRQNLEAVPARLVSRLPLVVITNRGTSSGGEVAAAALLDSKRAEVVGERTYGNAAVRKAVQMEDGSAVILSVAKYYSPAGKSIQDQGVTPTVAVAEAEPAAELDEEGAPARPEPETPRQPGEDLLLKKAIEVLTNGVQSAKVERGKAQPAHAAPSGPPPILTPQSPLNVPRPRN